MDPGSVQFTLAATQGLGSVPMCQQKSNVGKEEKKRSRGGKPQTPRGLRPRLWGQADTGFVGGSAPSPWVTVTQV